MDSSSTKGTNNLNNSSKKTTCNNSNNTTSQSDGIGLQNLSYADFVLLSSILSYAISEELNDIDLDLFIVFLGIIQSELATLRLQRGLKNNGALNAVIDTTDTGVKESVVQTTRHSKKVKKITRKRKRKIINNK